MSLVQAHTSFEIKKESNLRLWDKMIFTLKSTHLFCYFRSYCWNAFHFHSTFDNRSAWRSAHLFMSAQTYTLQPDSCFFTTLILCTVYSLQYFIQWLWHSGHNNDLQSGKNIFPDKPQSFNKGKLNRNTILNKIQPFKLYKWKHECTFEPLGNEIDWTLIKIL